MRNNNQHLIILAGGTGQRCWPLSRKARPKQFHDLLGHGKSLLQTTAERFGGIILHTHTWVVTHEQYADEVMKQLPWLRKEQILHEPVSKNTAPCIAYACYKIVARDAKAQVVITPSDHAVQHAVSFTQAIEEALRVTAFSDQLAVLGVRATGPTTGYGYIAFDNQADASKQVKAFVEKPSLEQAKSYLEQGNYAWHTGIIVGHAATLLQQYQAHLPTLWQGFEQGKELLNTSKEPAFIQRLYTSLSPLSFDYGILEKATNLRLILCADIGWSDIGSWQALAENLPQDQQGNVLQGNVAALATHNCVIKSTGDTLVATYGVKDLVIVQHDQVVMICPKDQTQQVKQLVEHLSDQGREDYL
ncbi:MAG: sugar phosphate nucleotidyltransferase [Bacteroidota bacterium]